jgi:hypothetical protein
MGAKYSKFLSGLCAVAALGLWTSAVQGQGMGMGMEVKEKPKMYTYLASWAIPRARWGEMEKSTASDQKVLDAAIGNGTLVGYGDDTNVVHQVDGATHDNWWSALSMAGVLDVLDSVMKGGAPAVLGSATMHADQILVSRFYNWHSGSYKGAYTHTALYKLKADAPDDAVAAIAKNFIVPLMDKLLAEGAIVEYEVDEEAIHTESPDVFWLDYICPNSAGLDKATAALTETMKANPMAGPALGSMMDFGPHRDYLLRSNATYK